MRMLKFEGYSDDTFGEYGVTNQDVDNCGAMHLMQSGESKYSTMLAIELPQGDFELIWHKNGKRV